MRQNYDKEGVINKYWDGMIFVAFNNGVLSLRFDLRTDRQKTRFPWAEDLDFQGIFLQNVLPKFGLDRSNYFNFKQNLVGSYGDYIPSFWLLPHKGKRYHHDMGSFALNERNH